MRTISRDTHAAGDLYTDAQLSGDEPLFETEVNGTGSYVVRVTADIVNGEVWPTVTSDGYGHLTLLQASLVERALRDMQWEYAIFRAWQGGELS